jgi:hypothetical protein
MVRYSEQTKNRGRAARTAAPMAQEVSAPMQPQDKASERRLTPGLWP